MIQKKKILYWPGMGKNNSVLSHFLSCIENMGTTITFFPLEYDKGEKPFYSGSLWFSWLEKNFYDWWIGISLGASLAYMMASLCEEDIKPNRLTLINPFQSRHELSNEKGFSLENQWDFSPMSKELTIKNIDMVISINDEKIPIHHGIKLLNHITCTHKTLIIVDDYHCIENPSTQEDLANILTSGKKMRNNYGQIKHCHFCK
ncbi:MAG: hypothetical protein LBK63_14310 [Treponema sp.]|jgi:hypothetical protein|nr:hypothetical protein [Treponema sp.]